MSKTNPIQVIEDFTVAGVQTREQKNLLTDAEWAAAVPPFYYLKITFDKWTRLEFDVAVKFAVNKSQGWVYYSDKRFIFERQEDFVLFKLWAENRPMQDTESLAVE